MFSVLIKIFKALVVLILPFVVLIRGATYFHGKYDMGPWMSLGGGMLITVILLSIYMTVFRGMISSRLGGVQAFKRRTYFALAALLGYCIHGLFFISSANLKNPALSEEMRQLHPIVRMAVSTIVMLDKDLVITDATRKSADYEKMGLPVNERSLHYPQADGYAYAIDLRTNGRSGLRNMAIQNYFRLMGFKTLYHTGTAPHLHISLKPT